MIRTAFGRVRSVLRDAYDDERGDVPGWVLITLMTAGLPALTLHGRFASRPCLYWG
jgi:hypothetical protein